MITAGYAGRFQPFGVHHRSVAQFVDRQPDVKEMIIIKGSSQWNDKNPDPYFHPSRNPFTAGECCEMIKLSLTGRIKKPYRIVLVPDTTTRMTDPLWKEWVKAVVSAIGSEVKDFDLKNFVLYANDNNIVQAFARIGCSCRSFPMVHPIRATVIRHKMAYEPEEWPKLVDPEVAEYLIKIKGPERVRRLLEADRFFR